MFKILMIAPTPFFADRGCHVRIYEEARELLRRGNRVRICTYSLGRDLPGLSIHRIIHIPFYHKLEAGPSYTKLILDTLLGEKALELARRFKPDIIHAHLHEGCLLGFFLKRLIPRPLVFDYQGSLSEEALAHGFISPSSLRHRALTLLEKWLNQTPDMIFTSSEYLHDEIKGVPDSTRTVALGDGVDTKLFRPEGDSPFLREQLGIPLELPVVVFLGLLSRYQGVDLLLEAIRRMTRRHPRVHFLIMGYPDEEAYRRKAARLGVAQFTSFPGRIAYFEASRYLSLGRIAVAPKISRTESNGKLLNYLACGLPVVAFDTPTNREILRDNAVYARIEADEEQSAENLAQKMIELLEDDRLRLTLSERGRKMAKDELGWDRVGRKMMRYYNELLRVRGI